MSIFFTLLYSLLFIGLFRLLYRYTMIDPKWDLQPRRARYLLLLVLGFALLLRLAIAPAVDGYKADIGLFQAWANHVFQRGPGHFYDGSVFADYPPGYMYVLYVIGALRHLLSLSLDSPLLLALIKMPAMLADIALSAMIYVLAQKHFKSVTALTISALYAFNPAVILNSAAWGQIDSFYMLIVFIAMLFLVRGRLEWSAVLFALAVLVKPQALMFGPILVMAAVHNRDWKVIARSVMLGLAAMIALALPFVYLKPGGPWWLKELYLGTLGQYNYASLNAFNLYALLGQNWQSSSKAFLSVPYPVWSMVFAVIGVAYCFYLYFKSKADQTKLFYIAFFLLTLVFMLVVKMHERYLYYSLLMGLASFIYTRDRRLLLLFIGFSVTLFINCHVVLTSSWMENFHIARYDRVLQLTSLVNVVLFVYLIRAGWAIYIRGSIKSGEEHKTIDRTIASHK